MDFERVIPDKNGSLYLQCFCKQYAYAEHLLPFWVSGILVDATQRVPIEPAPSENPRNWVSNELPWLTTFNTFVTTCCRKN